MSLKVFSRSAPARFVASLFFLASGVILATPALIAGASTQSVSTPDPTVSSFQATSSSLASTGGMVKLTATVTGAQLCSFISTPTITGLPASLACSNGGVKEKVILPANPTTAAEIYTVTLKVKGINGVKVKARTKISVAAATATPSVAFVQADDTGTINGNTTSIGSGHSNRVLAHDTGIGHTVVLMIQTLTDPGTETDTVTGVSSRMGTFHFVNSYNDLADFEIWVCTDTTGAADAVTVTTPTNAWNAFAVEFNAPATGYVNGGGQVIDDLPYLGDQSWTVSPGAAGNVAVIGVDTLDAYEAGPRPPWTFDNSGYWSFPNGTSAAWQVAPSSSPLTATWVTDGGESSSQGVVLEY
jgi:hypothetical protein